MRLFEHNVEQLIPLEEWTEIDIRARMYVAKDGMVFEVCRTALCLTLSVCIDGLRL